MKVILRYKEQFLYEIQTIESGNTIGTILVPSTDYEQYTKTPWFFIASNVIIKGGKGSGFEGHAGRLGEVGGSSSVYANKDWITKNVNIIGGTDKQREDVLHSLEQGDFRKSWFNDLDAIKIGLLPPQKEYKYSQNGKYFMDNAGNTLAGCYYSSNEYDPLTREIYIANDATADETVVRHEMGHHVFAYNRRKKGSDRRPLLSHIDDKRIELSKDRNRASRLGLRSYSFTDNLEFFADCFMIRTSPIATGARKAMSDYWKDSGFENIFD